MLAALKVLVGVDMGSAMSPLLFCIALDPLLVYLNRIPKVVGVRAYMDDNQIWGKAKDASLAWLFQAMTLIEEYQDAGLQVTQHSCCSIREQHDHPAGIALMAVKPAQNKLKRSTRWRLTLFAI